MWMMMMHREPGSGEVGAKIEAELGKAIDAIVAEQEGGMTMKWVCLLETAGADGSRGLWTLTNDGMKAWDIVGLLQHALDLQQAKTIEYTRRDMEGQE
jgi:hypothetical protein